MHLKVIGPRKMAVDEKVKEVYLPGLDGYLGILPGHRPLNTFLGKGELSFGVKGSLQRIPIEGGYAHIFPDQVLVFVQFSEHEA